MSRRILTQSDIDFVAARSPAAQARGASSLSETTTSGLKPDDYFSRLSKYIPAEVLSIFTTFQVLFSEGGDPDISDLRLKWLFWVCLLVTPLYLFFVTKREDVRVAPGEQAKAAWTQIALATVAFPLWALATTNPFPTWNLDQSLFALGVAVATLFFGVIEPKV